MNIPIVVNTFQARPPPAEEKPRRYHLILIHLALMQNYHQLRSCPQDLTPKRHSQIKNHTLQTQIVPTSLIQQDQAKRSRNLIHGLPMVLLVLYLPGVLQVYLPKSVTLAGWINAHRLIFQTQSDKPEFDNFSSKRFLLLGAEAEPITLKVHLDQKIGEGSMRKAFRAEVKSLTTNGSVEILKYVAKIRYHDKTPQLTHHATDALMYEASALLLNKFKMVLPTCQRLSQDYLTKGKQLEVVRHAVVYTGESETPTEVYFLEVALDGKYVKYSSNVDFRNAENRPGIDPEIARLLTAFTHWSYVSSKGKSLICDLQGVGPILTDPQIIDLDEGRWSDGNNSRYGIKTFLEEHVCNKVCKALGFGPPCDHIFETDLSNKVSLKVPIRVPRPLSQRRSQHGTLSQPSQQSSQRGSLSHILLKIPEEPLHSSGRGT
ncbi:hypothetical protein PTTG_26171 [Puccinia triticina 1-1 BBBD Race 1]|uniref:Alpha-type protein kinase domain-containing protein n=1 Tax=Puccinia triticina (isolate 1-1 / race 1 (BBBD)) TaxID=630390 RepID=A0A180GXX3_PUCT1|nr:hypothetical protein PTTG_26171 [Puccinia triticina 1-1 BBBD Race 1]